MDKCIAYLAPEIPALSATFVYNEILLLQERGYRVVPISIHVPGTRAEDERLDGLNKETYYLYQEGILVFFMANVLNICRFPFRYARSIQLLLQDVFRVGIFSRTGIGLLFRFFAASRVANILRKEQCEHVHVHFAHIPTDIAMYATVIAGLPFSFTAHANDLFERGWLLAEKIHRSKFAATISAYNVDYLVSQGGESSKINIIRCGVDSRIFTVGAQSTINTNGPFVIGTIGRMVEKKGFDVLIEAATILKKDNVHFVLKIAGDGPLLTDLKNLVLSLGLHELVVFKGPIEHDVVPAWLAALDLFVLPCQKDEFGDQDGIPVVLMEAMSAGIPVISTTISGIPELISDGEEGLLVKPKDAVRLAGAMERLLLNNELWQNCKENAKKKIHEEFDLNSNVDKLIELILK